MRIGLLFLLVSTCLLAQTPENNLPVLTASAENANNYTTEHGFVFNSDLIPRIEEGAYEKQVYQERNALPLPYIRDADVGWSKRLWRMIDTRQAMNASFACEFNPLIKVMLEIAKRPDVEVYADDRFTEIIPKAELATYYQEMDTIDIYNADTDDYDQSIIPQQLQLESFDHFRIKEDWLYDERHARTIVRTIGIAPIRKVLDPQTGDLRGYEVLFWMHYPSVREYLAKYMAYHPHNDNFEYSWQQIIDARWFESLVIKQSEFEANNIYPDTKDAWKKSDKILEKMSAFEYDLWMH